MPKRGRPHRLEAESRRPFEQPLPEYWLFRSEHPDYGIDGQVEVFDVRGETTGHRFMVQLKATDDESVSRARPTPKLRGSSRSGRRSA
jgi:hypothetical protein